MSQQEKKNNEEEQYVPKIYDEIIKEEELNVGDLLADKVFQAIKKKHYKKSLKEGIITLGDDYEYAKEETENGLYWRVVSNRQARIDGQMTGGYIYSFERKKSPNYYKK